MSENFDLAADEIAWITKVMRLNLQTTKDISTKYYGNLFNGLAMQPTNTAIPAV